MKHKLFLFSLLILSRFTVLAQVNVDSLLAINNKLSSEEEQLAFLNKHCQELNKSLEKEGGILFEKRQKLAEKNSNFNQQAQYANLAFDYFRHTFNSTKSDSIISPFFNQLEKITDPEIHALTLYSQSIYFEKKREDKKAIESAKKALQKYEEVGLKDTKNYTDINKNIGKYLTNINKFGESIVFLNKAQKSYLVRNDSLGLQGLYIDFAILFSQIGLFDEAAVYLKKRRKYMSEVKDVDLVFDLVNTGRNLIVQKRYDEALSNYHQALNLENYSSEKDFIDLYKYNGVIECLYFTNQRDSISYYFQKLENQYDKLNRQKTFEFLYQQSKFLYQIHVKKYGAAEKTGLKLYANSVEAKDGAEIEMHALFLSELYREQKDYENALKYTDIHTAKRDSTQKTNKIAALLLYQTQFETKEKEAAIEVLEVEKQAESEKSRLYGLAATILAGVLALLALLVFQLRRTRNQLAAQNQQLKDLNTTKDKFFGIIAHDIRSPITALDGVSEQMSYYLEKDNKAKLNRLADRIDTTAKRLTSLLDNLLNWALLQTGMIPYNPKAVDIQSVAQENIELFTPVAEAKNITLKNEILTTSPVFSDESALQTIIRNLVNNAIKFTPEGGEVSISTEEKGDKIFIKINDTGTGIAADKLEKLFSLNKQSSKGTAGEKGSGLGLMLCKELVELNKGTIQAISELGKGSSFVFSLPRE